MGSRLSHRIEGSRNAEEIFFFGHRETFINRFLEIFDKLRLPSVLSQCLLERGGRGCAVKMGPCENEVIGQWGQEMKHGPDVLILHHADEENEVVV